MTLYAGTIYTYLFGLLFVAWCATELLGPARWQGQGNRKKRDGGSSLVLGLLAGFGTLLFFVFPLVVPFTNIHEKTTQATLFFTGAALVLLGGGLRWVAIRTLGANFTGIIMVQENQSIIQSGPYTLIRHPSYAGILLIVLGFGLMSSNWGGCIAITVGMLTGILYRIVVEEKVLRQEFGQQYEVYMRRTKRMIPFVF